MFTAALLASLGLAACAAPVIWQKTGAGNDEQAADMATCRSYAAREADLEYQRGDPFAGDNAGQDTYQKNMAVYQARKSTDRLFSFCMTGRGYSKVRAQ